jgi:hypothetical protein
MRLRASGLSPEAMAQGTRRLPGLRRCQLGVTFPVPLTSFYSNSGEQPRTAHAYGVSRQADARITARSHFHKTSTYQQQQKNTLPLISIRLNRNKHTQLGWRTVQHHGLRPRYRDDVNFRRTAKQSDGAVSGFGTTWFRRSMPTFRRHMLSPSSGLKWQGWEVEDLRNGGSRKGGNQRKRSPT